MSNPFETNLDQNRANYTPLSPLSYLARAAAVYPAKPSVVHGDRRYTWAQTYARCRQLASALTKQGLGLGDTVSVMGFNTPETYEAHFGVPMMGGVLHAINTRLDAKNIAFMFGHAETKVLITDRAASAVIGEALRLAEHKPIVIDIDDQTVSGGDLLGIMDYEAFLATGDPEFEWGLPSDEWQAISLNYTSGTTGNPKGVVYHHRGAYLNATSNIVGWELPKHPVYLWTLPMFHCNGWCFPWTMAAVGGTNICLRDVRVETIYELIGREGVTHYCGAPIVHQMIAMASDELKAHKTDLIKGMVAGAPPPAPVLAAMAESGFDITHVYGLTETYGPAVICDWDPGWNQKSVEEQAEINARQGVKYHMLEDLIVADPITLKPVPADGTTMGEVLFRGNVVMKGYLKNPTASQEAFDGGWFRSGDLAVLHPDGYLELRDRSKDIIISGGENISTIEVEGAIFKHPAVMDAAVVAMPHEKWGETPCAFVSLKDGASATEAEIIEFVQGELARFKAPQKVIFGPLPKTSTGKTQKFALRDVAKQLDK